MSCEGQTERLCSSENDRSIIMEHENCLVQCMTPGPGSFPHEMGSKCLIIIKCVNV